MEEELVEGAGEQLYIPILPTDNLIRMGLEREQVMGSPIPKIWASKIEENLRKKALPWSEQPYVVSTPRKTPLLTRIKNNLADKLRSLATKLDGWAPQDADWYE